MLISTDVQDLLGGRSSICCCLILLGYPFLSIGASTVVMAVGKILHVYTEVPTPLTRITHSNLDERVGRSGHACQDRWGICPGCPSLHDSAILVDTTEHVE